MSAPEDDVLTCLEFKDSLNEHCFSRVSFIQWVSDDEFLVIFDSYFIVYRLTPFYKAAALTDKFPVGVLRFEIDSQASPSILQHCLNLLKYPEVDANFARATSDVTAWREINLTLADPVFLQPSLSGVSVTGNTTDPESAITISNVYVESAIDTDQQLFIIVLMDGRMYTSFKSGLNKNDAVSTTSVLYDYICENMDLFRSVLPELPDPTQPIEHATDLNGCKKILKLGRFLSTKCWFSTDLRYRNVDTTDEDKCGLSLQRSGHVIIWRYSARSDLQDFKVAGVLYDLVPKTISAGTILPINDTKCMLLLGTTGGEVFSYCIDLSSVAEAHESSRLRTLPVSECSLAVNTMRLFQMDKSRQLLIFSQQYFLRAAVLETTSANDVRLVASETIRIGCRFPITGIIPFENLFYVVSSDKVAKYNITFENGISFDRLADNVIALDKSRLVGMVFSKNNVLRMDAVLKKFLDRYSKCKPLTLRVRGLLDPDQLWTTLVSRAHLKDATDFMVLLRSSILHHEQSKVVGDLLIRDLESLESEDDPNMLQKLKVFRFATTVFSGKRSKAEDLEFWNRVREKVERLLVVKVAKILIERARQLDWSKPMPSIRQATAALIDFLATAAGVETSNDFGELHRPRCPLCDGESFQSNTIAEHVCINNHRYPACALTFLPIPSFSYRKCVRCDLPVLDRESISEFTDLIPEVDYCLFCDGRIVSV